ncbi:MAG TPA: hypothetical protein VI391_07035 [Thermoanaerobaculia bacterium]
MRSPAAAIAWEFRRRHRWGFTALGAYLLVLAVLRIFIHRVNFADDETFAFVVIIPITATFIYFLAIFSFGVSGDLAARPSIYPARMFTLPVTSAALAGWPMLFGSIAIAILWFATRLFGLWPAGVEVPIVWPALGAMSLLAWTQALTWLGYGLPGLRVIVTVLWLATIDSMVMLALNFKPSEGVMLALLAPHVPLAFVVARIAVARARRGDVPDWRPKAFASRRESGTFATAAHAQRWFEWRHHGRSLPLLVALVLPFELALLFLFRDYPSIVMEILFAVLTTPPFMAIFVGATVSYGLTSFITVRPMSDRALIAAKLRAALRSTAVTWLIVIAGTIVGLTVSGTLPSAVESVQRLNEVFGPARTTAVVLLVLLVFIASTWKQLVQSLYIVMTGREWLVKGSVFTVLALLAIVFPAAHFVFRSHAAVAFLWSLIPWIAAALVCVKLAVAAWIAVRETRVPQLIVWNAAVFALFGVLVWITPEIVVPRYLLMLFAILAVPLVRVSVAPLALAWNRHR